jgi:REP element-mobilizing transposase RayT
VGRRIRFHPPGSLVEVTCRTVQGRFLIQPTALIADMCRGVLARAVRLYPLQVHAFVFLGNHYHLLLTVPSAERLAAFMNYLNSNLAREVGRAVRWREKFWGRRYQAILVSGEPRAQIERLRYLLRHGCKENLVRRPEDWPGANAIRNLVFGEPVTGQWVDRTRLHRATQSRHSLERKDFVSVERFELSPLPCWVQLGADEHRARLADLVESVEAETGRMSKENRGEPLGRARLAQQNPHDAPRHIARRPAPLVHAASKAVRDAMRNAYRRFVQAHREASMRFRSGGELRELLAGFPVGSFLPPGPFVAESPAISSG